MWQVDCLTRYGFRRSCIHLPKSSSIPPLVVHPCLLILMPVGLRKHIIADEEATVPDSAAVSRRTDGDAMVMDMILPRRFHHFRQPYK